MIDKNLVDIDVFVLHYFSIMITNNSPVSIRFDFQDKINLQNYAKEVNKPVSEIIKEQIQPFLKSISNNKIDRLLKTIRSLEIPDKLWEEHQNDLKEIRKNTKLGRKRIINE